MIACLISQQAGGQLIIGCARGLEEQRSSLGWPDDDKTVCIDIHSKVFVPLIPFYYYPFRFFFSRDLGSPLGNMKR